MTKVSNVVVGLFIMMAFYSFAVTLITHALPDDFVDEHQIRWIVTDYGTRFGEGEIDTGQYVTSLNEKVESIRKIPLVNLAFMVFYTGNIVVDFMFNMVTAIPSMLTMPVTALSLLMNLEPNQVAQVSLFIYSITTFVWVYWLLMMLTSIRTGRVIE